ncbi:MAG: PilT/PilU family type 4a pilus ATPase [Verrucomicrobia bacterium]|nr:MAG: PilT/PilU family type 4a pilus ATPase [Verrucomicrobiota bacterium]
MNTGALDPLLDTAVEYEASDLHLVVGVPPAFRVNGEIILADGDVLTEKNLATITDSLLNDLQRKKFEQDWELCISFLHPKAGRMRVTFYRRNATAELSLRFCGHEIPGREQLGLPAQIDELARKPNGLVLITGPTGAGKTTTMNYMVNLINQERRCKIVTIEDPIEFVHDNRCAIVVQQEVMTDVRSFHRALIHVLRQDPDVIVIGELRDPETIATALTAAETGHLVFATMHSPSVAQAVERIVGVFEGSTQRQVVLQLANSLQGIIAQELLAAVDRNRRVLAYELVIATGAVRNIVRENQLHQLENILQMGRKEGMVLMDNCLLDLYSKALITYDTAVSRARNPDKIAKRNG